MSEDKNSCEADVCEACGTIVELGSVIAEDDTVLVLPFAGAEQADVNKLAEKYINAAKARFETVEVSQVNSATEQGFSCEVSLKFECTAEKLIFEMGLSSI
ncbi:hypothetical protein CW745_14870 [Psychromonas sp. psych-6C06]|uniref:DUF406 family protein n=1 Tax=Psychromonas sp. psych-6C06 TaxID=2058089 RepID=UPI000C3240F0|nr:DUF406 family protein [Psychromonas sp. psych-6C06]PKF60490.1 hypothetical protein CW745_14870 [Psychromonas sp. psych-6C06]